MHLTSYITLLFHSAFLTLSHKMPPTGLDGYANIVFLHFHMHYYFGHTPIPPVHYFTLWLTFKLWAVLAALRCFHSWDTHSLNCTQELKTTWHRPKRGARDSAMCERTQHSPAQYPSMVNQQRGTGGENQSSSEAPADTTAGAGDGQPTIIPSSLPALPAQ